MTRRRIGLAGSAALVIAGAAFLVWMLQGPEVSARGFSGMIGDVNRGAYVARLSGCIACHTDPRNGRAVLAGGAEIKTDFGSFYAPNITPHLEDGIGSWTLADFTRALTAGVSPEGRHYFPSFPYTFFAQLTDQDIVDLWAAVRSVPPVAGGPPAHGLRFPFSFHQGVGVWKRMFFEEEDLQPVLGKPEAWNRGRYLARGPAHCGACHTPRNALGGRKTDLRYAGGVGPDNEKIPPITPQALRKQGWTKDDLIYAFRSGVMPDGDTFGGSMAEVVRDGTRFWSDDDLAALAEYILDSEVDG